MNTECLTRALIYFISRYTGAICLYENRLMPQSYYVVTCSEIYFEIAINSSIYDFPISYIHVYVPITNKAVSSNPVHVEVYSIQHHVIKFVSDLRQVGGFLLFPPPIKLTATIQLKYC